MSDGHPGFPKDGLQFLAGLSRNNDREWFEEHRDDYERHVKAPMVALVDALNAELATFAPAYATTPARAIPRIHRDVRFSKDKSPYKTEIAAIFPRQGKEKQAAAGFYLGVSAKGAEIIAGCYMPDPPALAAVREHLGKRHAQARELLAERSLVKLMGTLQGESLARVPRGFEPDHPAADLLKRKQWYLAARLEPAVVTSPRLVREVADRFRAATPFVELLDSWLAKAKR